MARRRDVAGFRPSTGDLGALHAPKIRVLCYDEYKLTRSFDNCVDLLSMILKSMDLFICPRTHL